MNLTTVKKGDVAVIKCAGSLDADSIPVFKKAAYDLFDKGTIKFVLDASQMDFVDSMGLGVLISLLRRVKQKDGDIKVASLTPDVKTVFEITRLYKLFDVYESAKEAVEGFKV